MNSSAAITSINAAGTRAARPRAAGTVTTATDSTIDRALGVLIESGINFEVVDRCPSECTFCDEALPHAA